MIVSCYRRRNLACFIDCDKDAAKPISGLTELRQVKLQLPHDVVALT